MQLCFNALIPALEPSLTGPCTRLLCAPAVPVVYGSMKWTKVDLSVCDQSTARSDVQPSGSWRTIS